MSSNVLPFPTAPRPGLSASASRYAMKAMPETTGRAYVADYEAWSAWLAQRGKTHDEADDRDLANHMAALADRNLAVSTIRRRRAGIEAVRRRLRLARLSGPDTDEVLRGIAKVLAATPRRARPLTAAMLRRVIDAIGIRAPVDLRDRAMFLLAWSAALRSSEITALDWRDFSEALRLGGSVVLRKTKGERGGEFAHVPVIVADDPRYCAVAAISRWRRSQSRAHLPGSAIFPAAHRDLHGRIRMTDRRMNSRSIGRILQLRMEAAGLDPTGFSSHSFRAGFISEAAAAGVSTWRLKEHSRHRHVETLAIYVREIEALQSHPGKGLL